MKTKTIIVLLFVFVSACWAKNNKDLFRYAIPPLQQNKQINLNSLVQNNLKILEKNSIILLFRKHKDGSFGILPLLIFHNKDLPQKNNELIYNETDGYLKRRLTLLKEIAEYQKAIIKAEQDIEQLKQEHNILQNALNNFKKKVKKSDKSRLNRSE